MNNYMCNECKQYFTEEEFDEVEMERCPKCRIAYHQMAYCEPHKIGSYDIVRDVEKLTKKLCKDMCHRKECKSNCNYVSDKSCIIKHKLAARLVNKGWVKDE